MVALLRMDFTVSWGIVAIGAIHILVTPWEVEEFGEPPLWFASGGGALALVGILNLLAAKWVRVVPELYGLALGANLLTLVFLFLVAVVPPFGPGAITALGLVSAATALSIGRRRRSEVDRRPERPDTSLTL